MQTGFVSAVPYVVGAAAMAIWARRSDHTNERRLHTVMPLVVTAARLVAAAIAQSAVPTITAFAVTTAGIYAAFPAFWARPARPCGLAAAAAAIGAATAPSDNARRTRR